MYIYSVLVDSGVDFTENRMIRSCPAQSLVQFPAWQENQLALLSAQEQFDPTKP